MQSLWMLFAAFMFSVMGVGVKYASAYYSTGEMVAARGLIGALFLGGLALAQRRSLATPYASAHLWRGVIGVIALGFWFHSFSGLPLAMATTLNYTAPIWMAAILLLGGLWSGKKHAEWPLVVAIIASFAGVVMLLQPSIEGDSWPYIIVDTPTTLYALEFSPRVRKLGRMGEPEYRVVFYFSLGGVVAGALLTLATGAHGYTLVGVGLLLATGVLATVAQMMMTRAYAIGKALSNASLQYMGIAFSFVYGVLLFHDKITWMAVLGMCFIVASGLGATLLRSRSAFKDTTAPTES